MHDFITSWYYYWSPFEQSRFRVEYYLVIKFSYGVEKCWWRDFVSKLWILSGMKSLHLPLSQVWTNLLRKPSVWHFYGVICRSSSSNPSGKHRKILVSSRVFKSLRGIAVVKFQKVDVHTRHAFKGTFLSHSSSHGSLMSLSWTSHSDGIHPSMI